MLVAYLGSREQLPRVGFADRGIRRAGHYLVLWGRRSAPEGYRLLPLPRFARG